MQRKYEYIWLDFDIQLHGKNQRMFLSKAAEIAVWKVLEEMVLNPSLGIPAGSFNIIKTHDIECHHDQEMKTKYT